MSIEISTFTINKKEPWAREKRIIKNLEKIKKQQELLKKLKENKQ